MYCRLTCWLPAANDMPQITHRFGLLLILLLLLEEGEEGEGDVVLVVLKLGFVLTVRLWSFNDSAVTS